MSKPQNQNPDMPDANYVLQSVLQIALAHDEKNPAHVEFAADFGRFVAISILMDTDDLLGMLRFASKPDENHEDPETREKVAAFLQRARLAAATSKVTVDDIAESAITS